MATSSRHSWRNRNGASPGAQSRRSSAAAPITVTAFVDWKAQIHNARAADITEPRAQAGRTLKNVARIVDKVLTGSAPSARFRVAFRFYHGWHKGFEETENRKAMTGLVAETDFTNLSRSRNVRFLEEVRYGDELLTALPQRAHTRPPVHLPDTWRRQEQNGRREKMVDTALATDLLARAYNDPHEWALVLSEDDDMVPPVFTAEAWMKPRGGRVVIVRTQRKGKGAPRKNIGGRFLKLDGLMEVVDT